MQAIVSRRKQYRRPPTHHFANLVALPAICACTVLLTDCRHGGSQDEVRPTGQLAAAMVADRRREFDGLGFRGSGKCSRQPS